MIDIDGSLARAVKTGKVLFGAESALKIAGTGKVRLIVIASNCPLGIRENIEYYCKLSKIPLIVYPKTSLDLGRLCGKPFAISALAIRDTGDSDILEIAVKNNV